MVRVGGHAVADELRIDPRAAALGLFELLEHENAGALADDEPVAILVERAAGASGVVIARRERPQRGKPAHAHRRDGRLRAAGNHRVGVAAPDDLEGVADGVRRSRARGTRRRVRPLGAEPDRHLSRGEIDDGRGDEER